MPDDFISRKAAMDTINDIAAEFLKDHSIQCDIAAGVAVDIKNDVIKTLPSADVVEVVRCKDCKKGFRRQKEPSKLNFYWCDKWNTVMRECDFCSFGERRDS